ncbi:unnamed protein product [Arctogadus glacialis]
MGTSRRRPLDGRPYSPGTLAGPPVRETASLCDFMATITRTRLSEDRKKGIVFPDLESELNTADRPSSREVREASSTEDTPLTETHECSETHGNVTTTPHHCVTLDRVRTHNKQHSLLRTNTSKDNQ